MFASGGRVRVRLAAGLRVARGIMVRSFRYFGLSLSIGLGAWSSAACFGKLAYDDLPGLGPGGAAPFGSPVGLGGAPSVSEPSLLPSGGSPGSGGALPLPPPAPPPECRVDCCPGELTQITRALDGGPLDAAATRPYLSGDGAWVVFASAATNLAPREPSGYEEVYVYSLADQVLLPVPRADGKLPTGSSQPSAVSSDGRYVLFTSWDDGFAPGGEPGLANVFLFDRVTTEVTLVSRTASGSPGNDPSFARDLTPDGRYVVYSSSASDLTSGDDNGGWDVFVWDRQTGTTERVSMGPGDQQKNPVPGNHAHISSDGRYVSFHSQSDLLVPSAQTGTFDVFLVDRQLGTTIKVSRTAAGDDTDGNTFVLGMSDDARYLSSYGSATNLVPFDTNGESDVFLFDRTLGTVTRVNVGPGGQEAETGSSTAALSHDGRRLTFASRSELFGPDNGGMIQQSYAYEVETGKLVRLSENGVGQPGDGDSSAAELSASGRCFVLSSAARNLGSSPSYDTVVDVFVGHR